MNKTTYIIDYTAQDKNKRVLKKGTFRIKNKTSPIQAQIAFENYLKRKLVGFHKLIVHKCKEDILGGIFGNIFNNY